MQINPVVRVFSEIFKCEKMPWADIFDDVEFISTTNTQIYAHTCPSLVNQLTTLLILDIFNSQDAWFFVPDAKLTLTSQNFCSAFNQL